MKFSNAFPRFLEGLKIQTWRVVDYLFCLTNPILLGLFGSRTTSHLRSQERMLPSCFSSSFQQRDTAYVQNLRFKYFFSILMVGPILNKNYT